MTKGDSLPCISFKSIEISRAWVGILSSRAKLFSTYSSKRDLKISKFSIFIDSPAANVCPPNCSKRSSHESKALYKSKLRTLLAEPLTIPSDSVNTIVGR